MAGKFEASRRRRRRKNRALPILIAIILALAAFIGGMLLFLNRDQLPSGTSATDSTPGAQLPTGTLTPETTQAPTEPSTVPTEPDPVVSTASFTVTGDLLMHLPVIDDYENQETGEYDFTALMEFLAEYVEPADYAIANLETTFCGLENGYPYSGNPFFNCPDPLADTCKAVGFDMLLTANNHCYDTKIQGVTRTLEVVSAAGLDALGTRPSTETPNYLVKDVNGIQIGMTCYTFETPRQGSSIPCLNALQMTAEAAELVNTFHYSYLDEFYAEIGQQIQEMNEAGAEAIVVFMHWGEEYELSPNTYQKQIAQKLCDMGVDVIVGGHPHVIQPVQLLTATEDEGHKTLCIYSLGNLISNQRIDEMRMKTGHTEDGVFFNFTFAKYADGTVMVQSVDAIPVWVYMESHRYGYHILPLDSETREQWMEKYGISEAIFGLCEDSYTRTMKLIGPGMKEAMEYYTAVNEEYAQRLNHPELFPETTE